MEELSLVINQPDNGVFLEKIGWNKEQITSAVENIISQYEGITYTEEQIRDAKKDRAILNAMKTDISNRRIQVKKDLMAPYNVFEAEVKEVVAMIEKPIEMIDKQLIEYEEKQKEEKKNELGSFFNENVGGLEGSLTFDMIFNLKWLNKTSSLKSCKDEIIKEIETANNDLMYIDSNIPEKYAAYARDFYLRKNRNLSTVLREVARMEEIDRKAEEEKVAKLEAENARREQEEALKVQNEVKSESFQESNNTIKEDKKEPAQVEKEECMPHNEYGKEHIDEKIYKASFTIYGTKSQILSVRDFMDANNIEYGKVEK